MKKIENYVGAAKIKVFSSGHRYTCNYVKPILNFDLNCSILCVETKPLYLHVLKICFVFRLFAELQSLKGKKYMFNL